MDDKDWQKQLFQKALAAHIPQSGYIALTHRCSLMCVHCYLGNQANIRASSLQELSTEELKGIISQCEKAGTFSLTFSGGEPLLRLDFKEIYQYTIEKGILVSVMTNATLIDQDMIDCWQNYPPRIVEVSMYGATKETFERIAQVKGSFSRFWAGVELLAENNIRFSLKTVLMELNKHELSEMEELASSYNVDFRYDAAIFPCFDNEDNQGMANDASFAGALVSDEKRSNLRMPLQLRVAPEEVVGFDLAGPRRNIWQEALKKVDRIENQEKMYICGAGICTFYLDPYGNLQPCVMVAAIKRNLRQNIFIEAWSDCLRQMESTLSRTTYPCSGCDAQQVCTGCPGFFEMENGTSERVSSYICSCGKLRYKLLSQ